MKDKKARQIGRMTLAALGVVMGAVVDTLQAANAPNDLIHHFLDEMQIGFTCVLFGEAEDVMLHLVDVLRERVPAND